MKASGIRAMRRVAGTPVERETGSLGCHRHARRAHYRVAGGLVVMLVWMYYCAVVFLVGALITAMLDEHARVKRRLARELAQADAAKGPR